MEVLVRDNTVQFSDLGQVVATLFTRSEGSSSYFNITTAEDMAQVGMELLENWFVAFNERKVSLNVEAKPNVISGTIKNSMPEATYTVAADGTINVHVGDDTPFSLACVNSKYGLDMYRVVDNRLHELSLVQWGRVGNWSRDVEFDAILGGVFPNHKRTANGMILTDSTVELETLPVATRTVPLSVGHWAVMALNGSGGFSERGAVMTMRETMRRDHRTPCLALEVNHAKRFDISDEYVRAAYSEALGYPVKLELIATECNMRTYLVRCNYSHTVIDEELCPVVDEPVLHALHSEPRSEHLVTLVGMLPALAYMYEERQYVLVPLPVVGDLGDVEGHVLTQIEGQLDMVNGWITGLGTLILDAADAASLGIQPIQLSHNSITYYNQVMFGMTTTADGWDSLVRVTTFSINSNGVAGIMTEALDDRRNNIRSGRACYGRGRDRDRDDRGSRRRERGGRGR